MEVTITFRTPYRENAHSDPSLHERTLTDVPASLAEQMAEDFVQFRAGSDGSAQSKLYRYERNGEEVLVALDFTEIIALSASES